MVITISTGFSGILMMESCESKRRIVVTGLGLVSALGNDVETFWQNLLAGKSGIERVTKFDPAEYPTKVGAEVNNFNAAQWMDPKEARRSDPYIHYAIAASKMALDDASLDTTKIGQKDRFGVIIGSGIGGMLTMENQVGNLHLKGPRKVSPFLIPSLISNMASGMVAIELDAKGPNYSVVSACASASHSIGDCLRIMRAGDADIMITGGSEAAITRVGYAGFCSMKAMSTSFNDEPQRSSRPFDAQRDGFVMGEGAGVLVLETLEHALSRNARIYCELAGYGATCDAFHITSPDPEGRGLVKSLEVALIDAGENPESVDYINAHGTSTAYNDKFETLAVKKFFGKHAYKLRMSSTKSMTGHLLGAAGGIEAIASIKAIVEGTIPPTINQEYPDPECDLNYVPNQAEKRTVRVALSNNLGFGGHNATIAFKAMED